MLLGNSALDSRPYSFTGQNTDKPSYNNTQIVASLAGPLKIPNLLPHGPNMFLGYQRTIDNMVVRLRQLLGDTESTCIRSVRGVGYQWCGDE